MKKKVGHLQFLLACTLKQIKLLKRFTMILKLETKLPSTNEGDTTIIFLLHKRWFKIAAHGSLQVLLIVRIKLYFAFNISFVQSSALFRITPS